MAESGAGRGRWFPALIAREGDCVYMKRALAWGVVVAAVALAAPWAMAIKPMAEVEDGYPEAPGQLESENTFTLDHKTPQDHGFNQYSMENELEYGVSYDLTLRVKGAYFYVDSKEETGLKFDSAGVEAQYYFSNPNTDAVGVSVIGSLLSGDNSISSENFLVVQKDTKNWIFAYNLGLTIDVDNSFGHEHGGRETDVSIVNQGGVMYCLTNRFRIGIDASMESVWREGRVYDHTTAYFGPTINWIPTDRLWMTLGLEREITNSEDEPMYRLTFIVGYFF